MRKAFAMDFRSVRLFRILLGFLILLDIAYRIPVIEDFYTDEGVLPRFLWIFSQPDYRRVSLFMFSGSVWWAWLLFGFLALAAVSLILDMEVRLNSLLAFLILFSIHNRNWFAIYGADGLMRSMAIASLFLPVTRGRLRDGSFANIASVGAISQVALLYLCAGWLKGIDQWFWYPDAIYYAMGVDYFSTNAGRWISNYPNFLRLMTIGTFLLERFGWLLFFSPWRNGACRMVAVLMFGALHVGISIFMDILIFPLADIVYLTVLLPSEFWEHLATSCDLAREQGAMVMAKVDERRWFSAFAAIAFAILTVSVLHNFTKLNMPKGLTWSIGAFGFNQNWHLFAPYPITQSGYFVSVGVKKDGKTRVNPMSLSAKLPSFERPANAVDYLPARDWLSYLMSMSFYGDDALKMRLGEVFCEKWKKAKHESLQRVEIYQMTRKARAPGLTELPPSARLLAAKNCQSD